MKVNPTFLLLVSKGREQKEKEKKEKKRCCLAKRVFGVPIGSMRMEACLDLFDEGSFHKLFFC
jgi:hypothetical protein